jgi:hypothetical protein
MEFINRLCKFQVLFLPIVFVSKIYFLCGSEFNLFFLLILEEIVMKEVTFEMLNLVSAGVWAGPSGDGGCIPDPKIIKIPQLVETEGL